MNTELRHLHETLIAHHQALYDQLDTVTDAELAKALLLEMQELLHRISILQGLLFRESTAALKKSIDRVDEADAELKGALKQAETAADFVKGISKFLSYVDKAIDVAKSLAPMAGL